MEAIAGKECNCCFTFKPLDDFYHQIKTGKTKGEYIYYRPECIECTKKKAVTWREENPEAWTISVRKADSRPWVKEEKRYYNKLNRENGKTLEWQRNNKDKFKQYRETRKAKTHEFGKKDWESCKKYFNFECAYCGLHLDEHFNKFRGETKLTDFHREHVEHGGSNGLDNCVPSCKVCNSEKHKSNFEEWYVDSRRGYTETRKNKILQWMNEDFKLTI